MKAELLVGLDCKKVLIIPELMSLELVPKHILWKDIILPEIVTISGSVVEKCIVKSEFSFAELLDVEFEEAKYKKIEACGHFKRHTDEGFYRVKSAKDISLLTGIDTFVHKDEDGKWRVTEGITGTSIGSDTTRRGAINNAQAHLKKCGYRDICKTIIDVAGNNPSPRYEAQFNLVIA